MPDENMFPDYQTEPSTQSEPSQPPPSDTVELEKDIDREAKTYGTSKPYRVRSTGIVSHD